MGEGRKRRRSVRLGGEAVSRSRRPGAARSAASGGRGAGEVQRAIAAATRHHQAGRLRQAELRYRRILKRAPGNAEVLHLLGVLLHQRGLPDQAIPYLERAVRLDDDAALYHYNFAEVLRALGRAAEAAERYRRAIELEEGYADAHFGLGNALMDQGEAASAIASYRRGLELRPGDAETWLNLGNAQLGDGALDEAIESYRRAIAVAPSYAEAHVNLGGALMDRGELDGAVGAYRRAVTIAPDMAEAHYNLGRALEEQDDIEEAAASYRRAVAADGSHAQAHLNLGSLLHRQGDAEGAVASYRRALEIAPDMAVAHINLGNVLAEQGKLGEAEDAFRRAVAAAPEDAAAHVNLGDILRVRGRVDEAIASCRRACELAPEAARAYLGLGTALVEKRLVDEALESYRRALAIEPDYPEAHYNIGVCLREQGKFEAAAQALERALELQPGLSSALVSLATLRTHRRGDRQIARLQERLAAEGLSEQERADLNFALAKIYDDLGGYDQAFAHYEIANELKDAELGFDGAAHEADITRLRETFDAAFFERRKGWGVASELPLFIVGMPRSGTTLVEQIIASHPQVWGAGELRKMHQIVDSLPGRLADHTPYPECVALMDPAIAKQLAREYLDFVRDLSAEAVRVSDKMPHNFLRLGLIAVMLPRARIIHCRREALDTCLSCYSQNFASPYDFAYNLTSLGLYHRQYERLMAHWRAVLPVPMLELQYEELVADQEGVSRRLVAYCGLEWDDRCLDFHENQRPVRTASQWQVRQPLFTSSVGRWRNYEKHLGPLKTALAGAGR